MRTVCEGDIAVIDYSIDVVDNGKGVVTRESGRMRLRAGDNGAVGGIDKAVVGMSAGQHVKLVVRPEDAFGMRDPSLVQVLPRNRFEAYPDLKPGCLVRLFSKNGEKIEVVTREVNKKSVTVDANHPLAGMTLNFEITVFAIEDGK